MPYVRPLVLSLLVSVAAAACGQAPPVDVPEVSSPAATSAGADGDVLTDLEMPDWSATWIGKPVQEIFVIGSEYCVGYSANVEERLPNEAGVRVDGWGWSLSSSKPYSKFVAVDESGLIKGAGTGGIESLDVPPAVPQVTDPNVGFIVTTSQTKGELTVYGVTEDQTSACPLGPPLLIAD